MGKLAERLADASRSGVYRVEETAAIEEAAAANGYRLLRLAGTALPPELPPIVLFERADAALLRALKGRAEDAKRRGECFFAAFLDPDGKAAGLPPLYRKKPG
jgi:hypothetical protein